MLMRICATMNFPFCLLRPRQTAFQPCVREYGTSLRSRRRDRSADNDPSKTVGVDYCPKNILCGKWGISHAKAWLSPQLIKCSTGKQLVHLKLFVQKTLVFGIIDESLQISSILF